MVRSVNLGLLSLVLVFLVGTTSAFSKEVTDPGTTVLRDNWFIQPSADVHAGGEAISSVGFSTRDWYPATLPSTVMSALVEDKVYPDPYTGLNLRSIPGTTYPIFEDFSNIPCRLPARSDSRGGIAPNSTSRPNTAEERYGLVSTVSTTGRTSG